MQGFPRRPKHRSPVELSQCYVVSCVHKRSNISTPTSSMRTIYRLCTITSQQQSKRHCFTVFRLDSTLLLKMPTDFANNSAISLRQGSTLIRIKLLIKYQFHRLSSLLHTFIWELSRWISNDLYTKGCNFVGDHIGRFDCTTVIEIDGFKRG